MNLTEYMDTTGFTTKDLSLLPSVGSVINNKNGDVFPIMADDNIEFTDPMNVKDMYEDQFNSEEWFTSLHTCDKPVVYNTLLNLGVTTFSTHGASIQHGYSTTWGHGILDLYAALSPINNSRNTSSITTGNNLNEIATNNNNSSGKGILPLAIISIFNLFSSVSFNA